MCTEKYVLSAKTVIFLMFYGASKLITQFKTTSSEWKDVDHPFLVFGLSGEQEKMLLADVFLLCTKISIWRKQSHRSDIFCSLFCKS